MVKKDSLIGWDAKNYVVIPEHASVDLLVDFLNNKSDGEYYRTSRTPNPSVALSIYNNTELQAYNGRVANGTPIQATDPRNFTDWFTGWIVGKAKLLDDINYEYKREYKLYNDGVYQETYIDNYNSSPVK